ncbi:MAG TPA: hypothetical protein VKA02_01100 [Candidatus Acidoferrum sp.]|nr:hypothetical protein [Candidatus Acidoferrum sp.]
MISHSCGNKANRKLAKVLPENKEDDIYSNGYTNNYAGKQSKIANYDGGDSNHCADKSFDKPDYEASAAAK